MYPFMSPALELKRRTASDLIPGWMIGLLAGLQVVLWLVIIICEAVSVRYDAIYGTIYAGFWCSTIFFVTWISMFCFLCCGKANCCGIYLIVLNTIALCFSITLLWFSAIFVKNPCTCYGTLCPDIPWYTCLDPLIERKVPYLKGLLVCGVLMLLTNLTYIITYIAISIWLCIRGNADMDKMNATFQNQSTHVGFSPHQQQHPPYPMHNPSQINERQYAPYPMHNPSQTKEPQYAPYPMHNPSQTNERQNPPYLINDGYRQPLPNKPVSQQQPSQNDGADGGQF